MAIESGLSEQNPSAPRHEDALLRGAIAAAVGCAAGTFAFVSGTGIAGAIGAAAPAAVIVGGLTAWLLWRRPLVAREPAAGSRGLKALSTIAAVVALVQLGRLAVFMVDPSQTRYSVLPASAWEVRHSCFSAYFVASQAASHVPDLYDDTLYSLPSAGTGPRQPQRIGPFNVDVYEYPPPFLLLPRLLARAVPDFFRMRMLWFGLNGAVVMVVMLAVARAMGAAGTRALLLSPLVWASLATISTLQKGNVQLLIVAVSMLAMLLFSHGRPAAGGALLAYATASKLYPGLLLVYLLVRREWKALGWTAGFSGLLVAWTLADTGWAPFAAFLHHLPGILGGEAFPAFRNPAATAINLSVPGLVFKLRLFGVPGMGFPASKIVGWVYTIVAVWATVVLARRAPRGGAAPIAWLAVIVLATLRSPFLPQVYGVFPPLWLLALVLADAPAHRTVSWAVLGWSVFNLYVPTDAPLDPRATALVTLLPQALAIGLAAFIVRRPAAASTLARDPVPALIAVAVET